LAHIKPFSSLYVYSSAYSSHPPLQKKITGWHTLGLKGKVKSLKEIYIIDGKPIAFNEYSFSSKGETKKMIMGNDKSFIQFQLEFDKEVYI
jgi:hypothetical protein